MSVDPPYFWGHVCILRNVPSVDNPGEFKDRRSLIIYPKRYNPPPFHTSLIAVALSASPSEEKLQSNRLVQLPDKSRFPTTLSGLDKPSWANPDWLIESARPCQVAEKVGEVDFEYVAEVWKLIREPLAPLKRFKIDCGYDGAICNYCRKS